MVVQVQDTLANPAHLVHQVHLDAQAIQDKDLQDHPGLQVNQVMEFKDLKETEESQAFHPALEHITLDHQDHQDQLGLLGLKDQQVLLDREDTKVKQASQVCQVPQVPQEDQEPLRECRVTVKYRGSLDHQVHLDLLDIPDNRDLKVIPEFLVFPALQEVPSQSLQALLVLLVPPVLRAPSLLPLRCGSTSLTI